MTSTKSGVSVSSSLKSAFSSASTSNTRFLVVSIEDDSLVLRKTESRVGSWNKDFDRVKDELKEGQPCFVIFWRDTAVERHVFTGRQSAGARPPKSKIILMLFSPDDAAVREKMIYASSWSSLKDLCGEGADEYQASTKQEFSYSTFSKLREADESLLSEAERVLKATEIADPVSLDDAKAASGFSIIAASKGITGIPKVVQDSLEKAHAMKSGGAKRFKVENSSSAAPHAGSKPSWVTTDASVSSGETLVKPSQMKKWPPEKSN